MAKKKIVNKPPPVAPGEIDYSKEKLPPDIEALWLILAQASENTPEKREAAYQAERAEANRQLELLAVELEYNKKFYRKYGRYPYFRGEFYRQHGLSSNGVPNPRPIKNAQEAIEADDLALARPEGLNGVKD